MTFGQRNKNRRLLLNLMSQMLSSLGETRPTPFPGCLFCSFSRILGSIIQGSHLRSITGFYLPTDKRLFPGTIDFKILEKTANVPMCGGWGSSGCEVTAVCVEGSFKCTGKYKHSHRPVFCKCLASINSTLKLQCSNC